MCQTDNSSTCQTYLFQQHHIQDYFQGTCNKGQNHLKNILSSKMFNLLSSKQIHDVVNIAPRYLHSTKIKRLIYMAIIQELNKEDKFYLRLVLIQTILNRVNSTGVANRTKIVIIPLDCTQYFTENPPHNNLFFTLSLAIMVSTLACFPTSLRKSNSLNSFH